jgi:hypothetical protein
MAGRVLRVLPLLVQPEGSSTPLVRHTVMGRGPVGSQPWEQGHTELMCLSFSKCLSLPENK